MLVAHRGGVMPESRAASLRFNSVGHQEPRPQAGVAPGLLTLEGMETPQCAF